MLAAHGHRTDAKAGIGNRTTAIFPYTKTLHARLEERMVQMPGTVIATKRSYIRSFFGTDIHVFLGCIATK